MLLWIRIRNAGRCSSCAGFTGTIRTCAEAQLPCQRAGAHGRSSSANPGSPWLTILEWLVIGWEEASSLEDLHIVTCLAGIEMVLLCRCGDCHGADLDFFRHGGSLAEDREGIHA